MCLDETCYFLAIDFDDGEWQKDVTILREVCTEFQIPICAYVDKRSASTKIWK